MTIQRLTESKAATLTLTDDQASALRRIGRNLASDVAWWGDPEIEADEDSENRERTVIDVTRSDEPSRWRVKVKDAIGLVSVGDVQIEVEPKIPTNHLLYLLEKADAVPRLEETITWAATGDAFWKLIARWFLAELETVLRRDLVRDYEHHEEELKIIRGRVNPVRVAVSYYRGRLDFECEFEEFKTDTPLNRTLRTAARKVSSIQTLDRPTRSRSAAAISRMEDIGDLRPGDLRAVLGRNTGHYRNAILLARHLLRETGRLPAGGATYSRTFLIPTPKLVEKAVLQILREQLGDRWDIRPRSFALDPSHVRVNPDLVFDDGLAIGDVKYKLFSADWSRSDLYQNVAFATAFRTGRGCVIGFAGREDPIPPSVSIGDVTVMPMVWPISESTDPADAARVLVAQVESFLLESPLTMTS